MSLNTDDTVEILSLYARYNSAIDTGNSTAFSACFTPDGRLNTGLDPAHGTKAIEAFAAATHDMMPALRHSSLNIVVEGGPDTATGSAFLIGYDVSAGFNVIITGRYSDELARTADGWRFASRNFTADQQPAG